MVFRSWCRHCVATRAKEDPHKRTDVREGAVPKVMMDWLFFTSELEPTVMLPPLLIYDLVTGATAAVQAGKECNEVLVNAVAGGTQTSCCRWTASRPAKHWCERPQAQGHTRPCRDTARLIRTRARGQWKP